MDVFSLLIKIPIAATAGLPRTSDTIMGMVTNRNPAVITPKIILLKRLALR
jgi:hypothetical protein